MEDPGGLSVSIASHILTSSRLSTDGSSLESKTTCPTLVRRRRDVLILGHAVDEPEDIMSWKGMTPAKAMLAGATAGVTEHVCVFPVDTIKYVPRDLSFPFLVAYLFLSFPTSSFPVIPL